MTSAERIAVIGTGLIGTSVAMAAARAGATVLGWDADETVGARAGEIAGFGVARSLEQAVARAEIVVVATPIPTIPSIVAACLDASPDAVVTDVGSVKTALIRETAAAIAPQSLVRFVPGHPMGGSERSGPEHASASLVDGIVWAVTPADASDPQAVASLESWVDGIGARPVRLDPVRHDRLVAFVSHLPQIASTALMGLAVAEEAGEPDILLLAAGGFRDLTRLASSNPGLWSDILLANREAVGDAIDLYMTRLDHLRSAIDGGRAAEVRETFRRAREARLRIATKPTVRAGVAVLQVVVPDRPGALADLTSVLGRGGVNIEDLQIVHSPEGGRGTVHLTVASDAVDVAHQVLRDVDLDPIRLA